MKLIWFEKSRFQSSTSRSSPSSRVNTPNSAIRKIIDRNSDYKCLIAVYLNIAYDTLTYKALKIISNQIFLIIHSDSCSIAQQ